MFKVLQSCLATVVTETIGYEAKLAEINYNFSNIDDMGVSINITGYSDKIFEFAETYLDILFEHAKPNSFDRKILHNSMNIVKQAYKNNNEKADERATNNRLLFLVPSMFHDSMMASVLDEEIEKIDEEEKDTPRC